MEEVQGRVPVSKDEEWFCDLSVGVDRSGISPIVVMCRKPAKLYKFKEVFGEVALCEDHKDWKPRVRS